MKSVFKKRPVFWIAILITVQVICLCCVSVVSAQGQQAESSPATPLQSAPAHSLTDRLSERIVCAGLSRSSWLYELMSAEYPDEELDRYDGEEIFDTANRLGILEYYSQSELVQPLTRRFVCATLVKAFAYEPQSVGELSDVTEQEQYMATAAYYGYFLPDVKGRLYPDAQVTAEEFVALKRELDYRRILKDKNALSFGDSIMHGSGNNDDGMGEMIAAKYGMTCTDYSVPGATMGVYGKHGHIPNQVRLAEKEHRTADVIFLNGGTNDMVFTQLGKVGSGFDMSAVSEKDYSGGFEKCMWMIRQYWGEVPVIYVRSHNMRLAADDKEQIYGERGLELAEKWGAAAIDLYNNCAMNTENPMISDRYTCMDLRNKNTHDTIHPTALGYARFYLPPVSEALVEIFG